MSPIENGPQEGDCVELTIERLGYRGVGVARHPSGLVCLATKTLPGERIEAEVVKRKRRFAEVRLLKLLQPSAERVDPPCNYFGQCGGCHYQHLSYTAQAQAKERLLLEHLQRSGLETAAHCLQPIVTAPEPLGYRNRNFMHFDGNRLGFVDPLAEAVIDIDHCPLATAQNNTLLTTLRQWLDHAGSPLKAHLLDVMVREGVRTATRMVVLVIDRDGGEEVINRLIVDGPMAELLSALGGALSLYVNIKTAQSKDTFGDRFVHIGGPKRIQEKVGPYLLELSPTSFVQVNLAQSERLYQTAVEQLLPDATATADHPVAERPPHRIIDLYSGSGALAFFLSRVAQHVYGVEANHMAVTDATDAVIGNQITNVLFRAGKCERILPKLARQEARFDAATCNPPRRGLTEGLPQMLVKLGVRRLAYISCSVPTFVRDLEPLKRAGFTVSTITPFDMFPQTYHLELLAIFEQNAA